MPMKRAVAQTSVCDLPSETPALREPDLKSQTEVCATEWFNTEAQRTVNGTANPVTARSCACSRSLCLCDEPVLPILNLLS
jgi:hypothetical protein